MSANTNYRFFYTISKLISKFYCKTINVIYYRNNGWRRNRAVKNSKLSRCYHCQGMGRFVDGGRGGNLRAKGGGRGRDEGKGKEK